MNLMLIGLCSEAMHCLQVNWTNAVVTAVGLLFFIGVHCRSSAFNSEDHSGNCSNALDDEQTVDWEVVFNSDEDCSVGIAGNSDNGGGEDDSESERNSDEEDSDSDATVPLSLNSDTPSLDSEYKDTTDSDYSDY